MSRPLVPIVNLARRLPEAGRIRIGVKVAGRKRNGDTFERPSSIDTFRFTSHDQQALDQVAARYGGTVKPWNEKRADPGQFEVITEAKELHIVLPPDPLGGTPIYEQWSGGGCERRCDGVDCARVIKGPDGPEQIQVPCLCAAEGALACEPHTRLSVILPDVRFGGTWRLDTKGWDAAAELPGMVALLQEMQGQGLTSGVLRLEQRRKVVAGETRNFPVPVLGLADSMDALAAGRARFGALPSSGDEPLGALSAGATEVAPTDPEGPSPAPNTHDDEIVDAELVEDGQRTLAEVLPEGANLNAALVAARRLAPEFGIEPPKSCDEVTDYRLQARVLDELGVLT